MGATHSASATGHRADRRADDQDLSAKGPTGACRWD